MRPIYNIFFLLSSAAVLVACNPEVNFGEQYKKSIYIVNGNNILYEKEYNFKDEDKTINISVYCGGTLPTPNDIEVKLELDPLLLDSFNIISLKSDPKYVNKTMIPQSNYNLNNPTITIKAGNEYGVLKIPFVLDGLHVDSSYVLPMKIVSNNLNYEVNPKLNKIIFGIETMNDFSGEYSGSSKELPNTSRSVRPYLKAISENQVRMPIHNLSGENKFLNTNFMVLTIEEDGTVSITPWENAQIIEMGTSTYDKETFSFDLHYSFINNDGKEVSVNEKIMNLNATKE